MATVASNDKKEELTSEQIIKKQLIIRNLQEILGEDKLTKDIFHGKNIHIYWGTATTGRPHIAYLVPIQKIADFLRANVKVTILFADLHAFLDNLKSSFDLLENRVLYYEHVIKALLHVMDVPVDNLEFVRGQSYQLNEAYTKDLLRLSSLVSLRDAVRAGAEVVKQNEDPLLSGILYPLLQALDEQHLKVHGQFGGLDQRKIFILAEEQLPKLKFNKRFHLMNPMVPGLTGSKMSSSEENTKIDLLDLPGTVDLKIDSASCEKSMENENGILAFYRHVVFPILGQNDVILNGVHYTDFASLKNDFDEDRLSEQMIKNFLKSFLNEILARVQAYCHKSPSFADILFKAYPSNLQSDDVNSIEEHGEIREKIINYFEGTFGDKIKFIPSSKLTEWTLTVKDNSPKVLWRCAPKGPLTLTHFYYLLRLKHLKSLGFECTILISDLDAFLDKIKCPWTELKKRTDQFAALLKKAMNALDMSAVSLETDTRMQNNEAIPDVIQLKCTSDYQFQHNFTLEMYKMVSVVTRDQTALIEGGNTVGCHLCPIYFALDIIHANVDLVLLGPNQEKYMEFLQKIFKTQKLPEDRLPAFLIMPQIIGTDGQRMSVTKPDFHLDFQDGVKKIRQKIGKSFCEPGNLNGNVALELCRTIVFPFHKYRMNRRGIKDEDLPAMLIERSSKNGGNLEVQNYAELESLFLSQKLHPADLKAFLSTHIDQILTAVRGGQSLFN